MAKKKSSLKTFLNGENPLSADSSAALIGGWWLGEVLEVYEKGSFINDGIWFIDVLDDGTAITYCAT